MKRKTEVPVIVEKKCTGCGKCADDCPSFVIEMKDRKASITKGEWCIGCGHCAAVCPFEALIYNGELFPLHPKKGKSSAVSTEALKLLFRERRSVRKYTKKQVGKKDIDKIIEAGNFAPTGSNSQNVNYIVLEASGSIDELRKMVIIFYAGIFAKVKGFIGRLFLPVFVGRETAAYLKESLPKMEYAQEMITQGKDPLFYKAPAIILTHAESWDTCSSFNCSVALYNSSLMAHSIGIGCCFNGFLVAAVNNSVKIRHWLGIPANHNCYSAMTLGYSDVSYPRIVERGPAKVIFKK